MLRLSVGGAHAVLSMLLEALFENHVLITFYCVLICMKLKGFRNMCILLCSKNLYQPMNMC